MLISLIKIIVFVALRLLYIGLEGNETNKEGNLYENQYSNH